MTAEKNLISQLTKEGIARAKAKGIHCGRPLGAKNKNGGKLAGKEKIILNLLKRKNTKAEIAEILDVHRSTLQLFLKEIEKRKREVNE
jgi:DNA invertase Pin-like site-specific DNA recombinase